MKLKSNRQRNKTIIIAVVAVLVIAVIVALALILPKSLLLGEKTTTKDTTPAQDYGIQISREPETEYYVGQEFDTSNIIVQVLSTKNEGTKFLYEDDLTFSGFDSSVACEEQIITVQYGEFTTYYVITIRETVAPKDPVLVSINLSDEFPTTYTLDEWKVQTFTNVNLVLNYDDGSTGEIALQREWLIGVNKSVTAPCETSFKVSYGGFTCTVTVTITE